MVPAKKINFGIFLNFGFISLPPTKVPSGRTVTYGSLVSTIRPHKEEKFRTRVTVGSDKLPYPGPTSTKTASLTTIKIIFNNTISTHGARFIILDIKFFYYFTPMIRFKYTNPPLSIIPDDIITQYNLKDKGRRVYIEICQGMPGLKQAGLIANDRLSRQLAKFGYTPSTKNSALWKHSTRNISFYLVVEDFGVKYVVKDNAEHLFSALREFIPSPPIGKEPFYVDSP